MQSARSKEIVLLIGFLAMIAAPGVIQTVVELGRGEPLQALAVFQQWPTAKHLREYERELEESSWVNQQLRPWMQFAQFRLLKDAGDKVLLGRDGWLFYREGVRYMTQRLTTPLPGEPPNDPRAAILDLREQLAARGIQLLVMIAPNKAAIYPRMLSQWAGDAGESQVLVSAPTQQLLSDLRAAGVAVVDLFELFRSAQRSSPAAAPLYLAQDTHWSPAGAELAAKAAAEKILAAGWVERGTVAYQFKPAPLHRLGDVIRMLQVPQIEHEFAPEKVSCLQVIRQDDQTLYRDDPNAEILILGDSFLRIYEQDEPQSAGFIAHLARALGQPITSIVNDGGASTLVRQDLYRRPQLLVGKRLVIWEFVERDISFGTEGWQLVPLPPSRPRENRRYD